MDPLFALLEATAPAQYLKTARWGYAAVNGTHIFGIALLVGAAVPLALKMLGVWPSIRLETAVRLLRPVAVTGLTLAVLTGLLLFSIQARGLCRPHRVSGKALPDRPGNAVRPVGLAPDPTGLCRPSRSDIADLLARRPCLRPAGRVRNMKPEELQRNSRTKRIRFSIETKAPAT